MHVCSTTERGWQRVSSVGGVNVTDHTYLGKESNGEISEFSKYVLLENVVIVFLFFPTHRIYFCHVQDYRSSCTSVPRAETWVTRLDWRAPKWPRPEIAKFNVCSSITITAAMSLTSSTSGSGNIRIKQTPGELWKLWIRSQVLYHCSKAVIYYEYIVSVEIDKAIKDLLTKL